MVKYKDIDFESANKYFYYDETSPTFLRYKISRGRMKANDIAGSLSSCGKYYKVGMNKETYLVHRIIWVLFNGSIDNSLVIDHEKKVIPCLNKIDNLNLVTQRVNLINQGKRSKNGLPKYIHVAKVVDNKNYYQAAISNPITGRREYKSSYDLALVINWTKSKCKEFNIPC